MKILAFDQATAITGWAVFTDGYLQRYGKINLKNESLDANARHIEMMRRIGAMISEIMPDKVILEGVYLGKSAASLIVATQIQGAAMAYCLENGVDFEIITPKEWRNGLKFPSKAKRPVLKKMAQDLVMRNYEMKVTQDEADAICIGLFAMQKYRKGA